MPKKTHAIVQALIRKGHSEAEAWKMAKSIEKRKKAKKKGRRSK